MTAHGDPVSAAIFVAACGWYLYHELAGRGGPDDPVDAAHEAYVEDEIPLAELEERLAVAVDDRTQRLRRDLERINGVGPETSQAIASEFRTRWQLQQASIDDLTDIHDVGESTATAVREHVSAGVEASSES